MLHRLFGSKSRTNILSLFFGNENKRYYIQEIIKLTKIDAANVHRELAKLEELSLLVGKKQGKQKYYSLNRDSDYFDGLKVLFESFNQKDAEEKWFVMEEMPNYYPMLVVNAWSIGTFKEFVKNFPINKQLKEVLSIYTDGACALSVKKGEFNNVSRAIVEKLSENPDYGLKYIKKVYKEQDVLIKETDSLLKTNLKNLSNKELFEVYDRYYNIYEELHGLHWFQTCTDFGDSLFSKHLMDYLKGRIKHEEYSLGEVFSVLTTPTKDGNNTKEYMALLKILEYINKKPELKKYFKNTETRIIVEELSGIDTKLDKMLEKHVASYGWLGYGTAGPGWKKDYFIDILASLIRQNSSSKTLLNKINNDKIEIRKRQEKLTKELVSDIKFQQLFEIARELVFTKGTRKDSMFFSFSVIENFYREVGRRFYLSLNQVRYFYPHEFKDLLLKNKFNAVELNERHEFSIHHSTGQYKKDLFLIGDKAKEYLKSFDFIKEEIENVKILIGDCASPGRSRGRVTIVNVVEDMKNMNEGDVLVSIATSPDLVPAIKKASAIITDVGGITCHAAIISRELSIPCVVGTKIATKVLSNGDVVDVDAPHGKIIIIKKVKK